MSRVVLLLESCLADVPMVLGQLRPVILMPLGLLAGLPTDQIEALLLHELAHIRRGDYLFNLLQRSVECLLFYHPAVWWISRVMRAERENCCDDIVVATTGKAGDYAEALAALEQLRGRGQEPAVAAAGGNLLKRIRRLLYPQGMSSSWTPLLVALILMATAVVALAAWPPKSPAQKFASAQRPPETAIAPGGAHLKPLPDEPLAHFRLSADSRRIYLALARLAGLNVVFTSDFQPQPTSINLSNVKIEDALDQVARETKTFWKPITYDTILVIPDTEQNRQKYAKGHESSPYDLWLYQEVVYIISDQERRAFEALTTDKERDAFINAFWEARNPHPGSPENAFKEEHYRRIGYANEHFASTAHAGWQTGRGHMYILYGPADEIESHPEGPPYPFEQWRYWHIEGRGDNVIFTFIDPGRTGDYRLAPAPSGKK
jgi:GWxTD domain-containing protein